MSKIGEIVCPQRRYQQNVLDQEIGVFVPKGALQLQIM
jgi:hypothetical protein